MKVLIAGATGMIGRKLGIALVRKGHQLTVLSRSAAKAKVNLPFPCEIIEGDLVAGPLAPESLSTSFDVIINLAGESIGGGRWSESRKKAIYNSRILGTRHLIESLRFAPKVFLSASAVGFYGSQADQELTEESPPGDDFLSQVCQDWEEELVALSCDELMAATRVVALRTGVVLNRQEGALEKLVPLFRRGLGSAIGDGQQWMSWIHLSDAVGLILHAIENSSVRGALNVVAPKPVTNAEFTEALAHAMDTPVAPNVPKFAIKALLGEMSCLVLSSQRALATRAVQSGYRFKYPELRQALEELFPAGEKGEEVFFAEQYLPWRPEKVFPFFADAKNLERITPETLSFKIIGSPPATVGAGTEIQYSLKIHGVPASWKTLIKEWNPPKSFVDVQLNGPYTLWHHSHEFLPLSDGTLMRDRIRYRVPFGAIGGLIAGAFVKNDVRKIFDFRRKYIAKNLQAILEASPESAASSATSSTTLPRGSSTKNNSAPHEGS
jgi:hypothetical protein